MNVNIESLTVENYKAIKNAHIELSPGGQVVVISGANGQGKSSFIDAICELIDPKGVKLTSRPIRDGADKATATLTTDKWVATRTWTKNDAGTLTVKALDGATYPKASTFMREVVGAALVDPLDFARMSDKEQRDALLTFSDGTAKLLAELDERRKVYFDTRTDMNRDEKRARAILGGLSPAPEGTPDDELSASDVLGQINSARDHNQQFAHAASMTEDAERRIHDLRAQLQAAEAQRDEFKAILSKMHPPIDTAELEAKLENVETTNQFVRQQKAYLAAKADVADAVRKVEGANAGIEKVDAQKRGVLGAATFPVKGLTVDDEGVTYMGVPFKQISSAQKTAVAFELVTASRPDLRIVQIKDGSLLDSDSLSAIESIAKDRGYTVLVEKVDESGDVGFSIKNGELA